MSTIKPVTMWQCPITKKYFATEAEAKKSESKAKAIRTRKANAEKAKKEALETERIKSEYLINNANTFEEIFTLIKEKSFEFWGFEIESLIVSNPRIETYNAPPSFKFRLEIRGKKLSKEAEEYIKKLNKVLGSSHYPRLSISNIFKDTWGDIVSGFKGVKLGSGNPGSWGEYPLSMDASIEIGRFPKILEEYHKYINYKREMVRYSEECELYNKVGRRFAKTTSEYISQKQIVDRIREELDIQNECLKAIEDEAASVFKLSTSNSRMGKPNELESCRNFELGELRI